MKNKLVKESLEEVLNEYGDIHYVTKEMWDSADEDTRMNYLLSATDDWDEAEKYLFKEFDYLPDWISVNMSSMSESLTERYEEVDDWTVLFYGSPGVGAPDEIVDYKSGFKSKKEAREWVINTKHEINPGDIIPTAMLNQRAEDDRKNNLRKVESYQDIRKTSKRLVK